MNVVNDAEVDMENYGILIGITLAVLLIQAIVSSLRAEAATVKNCNKHKWSYGEDGYMFCTVCSLNTKDSLK